MRGSGVLAHPDTYLELVACCPPELDDAVRQIVREAVPQSYVAHVTWARGNQFEYPGIRRVYDLACTWPDRVFGYMHSKGMVFSSTGLGRTPSERKLTHALVSAWPKMLEVLGAHPDVQKVGLYPSDEGWIWFNFWWARGAYLVSCKAPTPHPQDRYFFESWLGREGSKTAEDCFSLVSDSVGTRYVPYTCLGHLDVMPMPP